MPLPAPVVPCSESAVMDAAAVALGQDLGDLMEAAGSALAAEAERLAPAGRILVACGAGNNGGDGYVCARRLAAAGRDVSVWPLMPPRSDLARAMAARLPANVVRLDAAPADSPALIVDAVLGAGAEGPPRPPMAAGLRALRALRRPILAADTPSGLGSDDALPATLTLCFQTAKRELLGRPETGEFKTVDIGMDPRAFCEVQPACLRRFPPLRRDARKGVHGELLVVGGGPFPGALEFAARAALLTGCDLVRCWTTDGPSLPPSLVVHRQDGGHLAPADPQLLTPLLARARAVLIGNGLGREPRAHEAAQQALSLALEMGVPAVLDADGIAACAELVRSLPAGPHRLLLTPHAGEARNLLGEAPTPEAVHAFARPDRVLLAKGVVDLVSDGWRWQSNPRGNPRLAVGGTGDLLAGLAAGLLARGCEPFDAARIAVLWLTTAGDELWPELGPCYLPEDVLARLPSTLRQMMGPLGLWPPVAG